MNRMQRFFDPRLALRSKVVRFALLCSILSLVQTAVTDVLFRSPSDPLPPLPVWVWVPMAVFDGACMGVLMAIAFHFLMPAMFDFSRLDSVDEKLPPPKRKQRRNIALIVWGIAAGTTMFLFPILWVSLWIGGFAAKPVQDGSGVLPLVAVGLLTVFSFPFRYLAPRFLRSLSRTEDKMLYGYILAVAMCEMTALVGLLAGISYGLPQSPWVLLTALAGVLLHFPRRGALEPQDAGANPDSTT